MVTKIHIMRCYNMTCCWCNCQELSNSYSAIKVCFSIDKFELTQGFRVWHHKASHNAYFLSLSLLILYLQNNKNYILSLSALLCVFWCPLSILFLLYRFILYYYYYCHYHIRDSCFFLSLLTNADFFSQQIYI